MRRSVLVVGVLLAGAMLTLVMPSKARADAPASKHARFDCLVSKPVTPKSPATVDVVFYFAQPKAAQIEVVVKACLDAALAVDSSPEILVSVHFSKTGRDEDEDLLPFRGNEAQLLYNAKTKKLAPISWE
jgi:hypothetical protein